RPWSGATSIPRASRCSTRFGASSLPTIGTSIGDSAVDTVCATITLMSTANSTGPSSGPNTNAEKSVRRSRALSSSSFRQTVQAALIVHDPPQRPPHRSKPSRSRRAPPRSSRRRLHRADEDVLEAPLRIAHGELGRRAGRGDPAAGNDHEIVDERLDLLHDVARQQHAAAVVAKRPEPF